MIAQAHAHLIGARIASISAHDGFALLVGHQLSLCRHAASAVALKPVFFAADFPALIFTAIPIQGGRAPPVGVA